MSLSDRTFDPRYGEPVEVAPHVVRITAPNSGKMTFRGTNSYLVGDRSLVVVDPGPEDHSHLAALLAAIGGRPVSAILLTHGHRDHDALAGTLRAETGAPLLAHPDYRRPVDGTLTDGAEVPGSEQPILAVSTPGHAPDHLAFALPMQASVLTGDHVMGWSTTVVAPPEGRMGDYMRSLDHLAARSERRYLPGHGDAVEDGPDLVRALRVHRRMREAAILERLQGGTSRVATLVEELYRGLEPALRPAAALSVLAHLVDLVERGRASAPDGPELGGRFLPVPSATVPGSPLPERPSPLPTEP